MPGYRATTAVRRDIDILVRGSITTQDVTRAQAAIAGCLDARPAVERIRVKLAEYHDRRHSLVCVVQINLDVASRLVRAQEWAPSLTDALSKATAVLAGRATSRTSARTASSVTARSVTANAS